MSPHSGSAVCSAEGSRKETEWRRGKHTSARRRLCLSHPFVIFFPSAFSFHPVASLSLSLFIHHLPPTRPRYLAPPRSSSLSIHTTISPWFQQRLLKQQPAYKLADVQHTHTRCHILCEQWNWRTMKRRVKVFRCRSGGAVRLFARQFGFVWSPIMTTWHRQQMRQHILSDSFIIYATTKKYEVTPDLSHRFPTQSWICNILRHDSICVYMILQHYKREREPLK